MVSANTVKSTFTYRAHVLFQILASCFTIVIQFFLWKAVYSALGTPTLKGMTFNQTFLYVSLAAALMVLMRTWTDWGMNAQIRSGDIIMFFFKPVNYMKFVFADSFGAMMGNFITITLPSFVVVFAVLQARIMLSWNILFFFVTLVGSCALSFLFDFIIGTTCFWTQSVWGLSAAKDCLITFLSGALVPLQFYPDFLLKAIKWLPFPYMYNLPLSILSAERVDIPAWAWGICVQMVWILVVYALARAYFNFSLKKLTVNGG
jgi:ABC-2 type transport system permease protein